MKYKTHTLGIALRISSGFLVIVLLLVALTYVGLNYITQVNSKMERIVENNNVKIELAQVMQQALYERALSMHSIAVLDDDFLKDNEFMNFNRTGSKYYMARKKLEGLATGNDEKQILETIRELTQQTQPEVQEVVDIGLSENKKFIFDKIRNKAIPKQQLISKQVKKLVLLQQQKAAAELEAARNSYKSARNLMILLGSLATVLGIMIAIVVIRHVMQQAHQLEYKALHDELTGLPNRFLFQDRLKETILRGQRLNMAFSVILIDLDRFKYVNDTFGHGIGDLLLQEVARRLKESIRAMDTVARLGGDEYVILLESVSAEDLTQFADKITDAIAEPFLLTGETIEVGVSMGISSYPVHGQDCVSLLKWADVAMYEAKRKHIPYVCCEAPESRKPFIHSVKASS